jgi:hypothetical protein
MIGIRRCLVSMLAVSAAVLAALSSAAAAQPKKHAAPAAAAQPATPQPGTSATRTLGTFAGWTAYASQDKTGRVCYLVGQARKSEPAGFPRKAPMAMVTHRPTEQIANVVSFVEGYPLKDGSEVALDIGGSKFELFTKDDGAWARTTELDKTIVTALSKARQAVVKGMPQKGPGTTDVYPLAGFAKALAAIDKACGVQREEKSKSSAAPHQAKRKHRQP